MIDLGKIIFDHIFQLIICVIDDKLKTTTLTFLEQRRIKNRVENATAEVVESLIPFLLQEKVEPDKLDRLMGTCIEELTPFTLDSAPLFQGSLDGQKIYDDLYLERDLPQVILEDDLKNTYSLLFPRIATLMCKIPATVKDWENEAWSENYRRFDEVVAQLNNLFIRVDDLANSGEKNTDNILKQFKRLLTQKIGFELDITGLRADQPYSGKFNDFFVLPEIKQILKEKKDNISITQPLDCFLNFTNPNCLNIVIGAPGAGKSTWSKWVQRETLHSDWPGIGIRIELRSLKVDELPSTYELIRSVAGRQMQEDLSPDRMKKWVDDRHIVLILDGFDEIKPIERDKFLDWIKELKVFANECPIVITSRPLTTDHLDRFEENWKKWNIEPFDLSRIIEYIKKWYNNSPLLQNSDRDIEADQIGFGWINDPTIGSLTGNPLLLSTLLMVHHLDGKLPNGRANLYKRYIDGMLGFWDERNQRSSTSIDLAMNDRRKIIKGMALFFFLQEEETIEENTLINWLDSFLPKIGLRINSNDVLQILRERTGLIIGPGVYNFVHKTISEYLVAETVFDGDQLDKFGNTINSFHLYKNRKDDRWNTILFLWAGIVSISDLKSFIRECIKSNSWPLAYGLIFDQYNRLTAQDRQDFLLTVGMITNRQVWNRTIHWICEGGDYDSVHDGEISIKMPFFDLRGLSTNSSTLYNLFRNAVIDGSIDWPSFSNFSGKAHQFIWGIFATTPQNHIIWREVISCKNPTSSTSDWKKLIAHWVFTVTEDILNNFPNYVQIYSEVYPKYRGYLPIALMNRVSSLVIKDGSIKLSNESISRYIELSISLIIETPVKVITPYLKQTEKWKIIYKESSEQTHGDLLDLFISAIKQFNLEQVINIDSTIELNLNKKINQLKAARIDTI